MARPTKMTPGIQELILRALRAGNTETNAAAYAGVAYDTYRVCKRRDQEFSAAIEKAQADAEAEAVAHVRNVMPTTWQAAAWWLERRRPQDYGRVDRLELALRGEAEELADALGLERRAAVRETQRLLREAARAHRD
jgi:hypothetical protein